MDAYQVQDTVDRWTVPAVSGGSGAPLRAAIARAQGPVIHDTAGRRYLDFGSGSAAAILGHNHPRYVEIVRRRLHTICVDAFMDADALELHCRLGEILTPPLQKSLLVPHREAALRSAIGMARAVTGGTDILTVFATHDGELCFAYPATAISPRGTSVVTTRQAPGNRNGPPDADPIAANARGNCPDPAQCMCGARGGQPCPWAAFDIAMRACERRPAALLMTPFAGGALGAWPGCARMLRKLCHQHGMLLILDETATGYGRTGRMWGYQHDDQIPDILITSARFGAGLSIHAVCTAPDIAEQVTAGDCLPIDGAWHDPVACTAAVTGIDIIKEEDLVARAAAIGEHLGIRLDAMAADKPMIRAVRGRGAMYTIELAGSRDDGTSTGTPARALAQAAVRTCRAKGLLLRESARDVADGIVRVYPPLVSTETQIDEGLDILDRVLRGMASAFDTPPAMTSWESA